MNPESIEFEKEIKARTLHLADEVNKSINRQFTIEKINSVIYKWTFDPEKLNCTGMEFRSKKAIKLPPPPSLGFIVDYILQCFFNEEIKSRHLETELEGAPKILKIQSTTHMQAMLKTRHFLIILIRKGFVKKISMPRSKGYKKWNWKIVCRISKEIYLHTGKKS